MAQKDRLYKAISIATENHQGQKDLEGDLLIHHPLYVMGCMISEEEMIVAVLHDVVESTTVSLAYLERYFSPHIVEAIDAISRRENEPYTDYIKRVKANKLAYWVKVEDLRHNISKCKKNIPKYRKLLKRYDEALAYLSAERK